ncbi:MAG: tetratricopeptide repeat protein [Terracidiphilus sp.]
MTSLNAKCCALTAALILFAFGAALTLRAQSGEHEPAIAPAANSSATKPVAAEAPQAPTPEQLGDSLVSHQRYQAAIAAYGKSGEMTATLWNKMGIAYQMLFNLKDAGRCYRESLRLDPDNPDVLNNLGTLYASQKQYGQADRMYRKALRFRPESAIILKNLGTNLLAEHKYEKGWAAYQQALAIDPEIFTDRSSPTVDNPSDIQERGAMNYYMAAACSRGGNTDCALQYLRMALDEGFTTRKKVAADIQFASLRNNPAFQQLLAEQHN